MRRALHAEWTKLRTIPGTGWLLLAVVVVTAGVGAAATASCLSAGCAADAPKLSLMGVQVSQAVVAILAVLAVTGEYGTGMARTTFTAMPRRVTVLAAKALTLTCLVAGASAVAVLVPLLSAGLSLADGPTLRAATGSVLYLALIGLLSLGIAVCVRDSAVAIGVVFGLIYVLGGLPFMVSDPWWQVLLWRISPMNAGLAVQFTTHLSVLPLPPWAGLGVLAAWAAAALLGGGLLLVARDA